MGMNELEDIRIGIGDLCEELKILNKNMENMQNEISRSLEYLLNAIERGNRSN